MANKKPILVCVEGPSKGKSYPVAGVVTIGREAEREVHVEDKAVSRKHAKVEVSPNGYVITDLGSANGTLVNGSRLEGTKPLRNGDVIKMGQTTLRFEFKGEEKVLEQLRVQPSRPASAGEGKKKLLVRVAAGVLGLMIVLMAVAMMAGKKGDDSPAKTSSQAQKTEGPRATPEVGPDDATDEGPDTPEGSPEDVADLLRRADQLYEEREIALGSCWMAIERYEQALEILRNTGNEELQYQTVAKLEAANAWLEEEYESRKKNIDRNVKQAQNMGSGPRFDLLIRESYRLADEITELIPDKMDKRHSYGRKRKLTLGKYAKK